MFPSVESLALRPYQAAAIEQLRARVAAGRRAPLLVAPTGAGKGRIIAALAALHLGQGAGRRVLALAHRRELVQQLAAALRSCGLEVAELHPDARAIADEPVIVASTQTLLARGEAPGGITLSIFDEAHHYSADDWSKLTDAFPGALRVGCTATPVTPDGRGLSPAFDSMVVVTTVKELTAAGYLVPCRVVAPEAPLRARELVARPVDAYLEHAGGERTVVFAQFVADADAFRDEFVGRGVSAVVVHGAMSIAERDDAIRAHRESGAVLINCMVLTEGWDSPSTSVCILARGCGSVGTYLQIVGRVLRTAPGKERALLIDLTGRAFHTHGAPDDDREFSLTGQGIRSKGPRDGVTCFVCGSLVDGWPCDVCGHVPTGVTQDPIRVVGGELAERFAQKRIEDANGRIDTLARWIAEAKARGWKPWSAIRKYGHVYGRTPCPSYLTEATIRAKALHCAACVGCGRAAAKTYRGGRCGKCAFGSQKGAA